jgi:hypothetical protein
VIAECERRLAGSNEAIADEVSGSGVSTRRRRRVPRADNQNAIANNGLDDVIVDSDSSLTSSSEGDDDDDSSDTDYLDNSPQVRTFTSDRRGDEHARWESIIHPSDCSHRVVDDCVGIASPAITTGKKMKGEMTREMRKMKRRKGETRKREMHDPASPARTTPAGAPAPRDDLKVRDSHCPADPDLSFPCSNASCGRGL